MTTAPESRVELVITAPESLGPSLAYRTRCRTTIGALTELIAQASRDIVIAAPFMQAGWGLSAGTLADSVRHALLRGVDVDILGTALGLHTIDRPSLASNAQGRLRLFQPSVNASDEQQLGSHAKFCVADGSAAYVGSANLTGKGLSDQIEMGVLVHGDIARQIKDFWDYAVEAGLFLPVED